MKKSKLIILMLCLLMSFTILPTTQVQAATITVNGVDSRNIPISGGVAPTSVYITYTEVMNKYTKPAWFQFGEIYYGYAYTGTLTVTATRTSTSHPDYEEVTYTGFLNRGTKYY